jgi:hypothetical protein
MGKGMETKRLKMVSTGVPTDTDAKQISNPGKQCEIMGGGGNLKVERGITDDPLNTNLKFSMREVMEASFPSLCETE